MRSRSPPHPRLGQSPRLLCPGGCGGWGGKPRNEWPAPGLVLELVRLVWDQVTAKRRPWLLEVLTPNPHHSHTPRAAPLPTCDGWFLILSAFEVLLHQLGRDTDHVLALPVLDHVEGLESADDVILSDARHLATQIRADAGERST